MLVGAIIITLFVKVINEAAVPRFIAKSTVFPLGDIYAGVTTLF